MDMFILYFLMLYFLNHLYAVKAAFKMEGQSEKTYLRLKNPRESLTA